MAIDTVRRRASSAGLYWPTMPLDRITSLQEYGGIGSGSPVVPVNPGIPDIWNPTTHTPTHHLATSGPGVGVTTGSRAGGMSAGTPGGGLSSRSPGNGLTIRRRK